MSKAFGILDKTQYMAEILFGITDVNILNRQRVERIESVNYVIANGNWLNSNGYIYDNDIPFVDNVIEAVDLGIRNQGLMYPLTIPLNISDFYALVAMTFAYQTEIDFALLHDPRSPILTGEIEPVLTPSQMVDAYENNLVMTKYYRDLAYMFPFEPIPECIYSQDCNKNPQVAEWINNYRQKVSTIYNRDIKGKLQTGFLQRIWEDPKMGFYAQIMGDSGVLQSFIKAKGAEETALEEFGKIFDPRELLKIVGYVGLAVLGTSILFNKILD